MHQPTRIASPLATARRASNSRAQGTMTVVRVPRRNAHCLADQIFATHPTTDALGRHPFTRPIVERYGVVRAGLVARGIAKGDLDLLIGCTALEHGATLVTNDAGLKDGSISHLVVEDWLL